MYFRGTYVFLREGDYSSVVNVGEVDTRTVLVTDNSNVRRIPRSEFSCSLEKPEEGFYQLEDDLVFLLPVPYRGVLKGFGHHNLSISPLCNWKYSGGMFGGLSLDTYTVDKLFKNQTGKGVFAPAEDSLSKVTKGEIFGAPLSRQMAITQGFFSHGPSIWFENMPVAEFHPRKTDRSVVVHELDFFDEVEALLGKKFEITRLEKKSTQLKARAA